jgi:hypothetical protein
MLDARDAAVGFDLQALAYSEDIVQSQVFAKDFFQQAMEEVSVAVLGKDTEGAISEEDFAVVQVLINTVGREIIHHFSLQLFLELQAAHVHSRAVLLRQNEVEHLVSTTKHF